MSTSLLYNAFGIRGYDYVRTEYWQGGVYFTIRQRRADWRCSVCGERAVLPHGQVERRFKTVPIGTKRVTIVLPIQRVACRGCGRVRQVEIGFADPRRSYTRAFERYALELCQYMTIQDVAHLCGRLSVSCHCFSRRLNVGELDQAHLGRNCRVD